MVKGDFCGNSVFMIVSPDSNGLNIVKEIKYGRYRIILIKTRIGIDLLFGKKIALKPQRIFFHFYLYCILSMHHQILALLFEIEAH